MTIYQQFLHDKQSFFNAPTQTKESAVRLAKEKSYSFIAPNRLLIQQEFEDLFSTLNTKTPNTDKTYWMYCLYCSLMLQSYYEAYGKFSEAKKYEQYTKEIEPWLNNKDSNNLSEPDSASIQKSITNDLKELMTTPRHVTKVRNWVSFANITRLQLAFSRIFVKNALVLSQEFKWIEKFDAMFGIHSDVNGMMTRLNSTTNVFNALSVGFFLTRFLLNSGMLLKHTFLPSDEETKLSMWTRFILELEKRYCDLINDIVWFFINMITNYASLFNIPAPVANWLTASFLLFDVMLLTYRRYLVMAEFAVKEAQYLEEIKYYKESIFSADESTARKANEHIHILENQLELLILSRDVTSATYWFNVAAASILMSGFSAALLLSASAATVSFFICSIAIAMYLSADLYGAYYKDKLILEQVVKAKNEIDEEDMNFCKHNVNQSSKNLIYGLVKNTVMPTLIVTTFAVSIPASLLLVVAYVGYETTKGYFNQPKPELIEDRNKDSTRSDEEFKVSSLVAAM